MELDLDTPKIHLHTSFKLTSFTGYYPETKNLANSKCKKVRIVEKSSLLNLI